MSLFSKVIGLGCQSAGLVSRRWHSVLSSGCCPSVDVSHKRFAQSSAAEEDTKNPNPSKMSRKERQNEAKDRRVPVPWEVSVRYMESQMYRKNYGDYKVWQLYRRPLKTQAYQVPFTNRISCVKDGFIAYATPCPICRDRNLVLHENNVKLLEQFIDPWTKEVYDMRKVHVCQVKYEDLLVAMYKARDLGLITFSVPFRQFNYEEFYSKQILTDYDNFDYNSLDDNPIYRKLQDIQDPTNIKYTTLDFP